MRVCVCMCLFVQETKLKGVLYLYGCRCYPVRIKSVTGGERKFAFEIEAAMQKATPEATTPRSLFSSFFGAGASPTLAVFNPIKADKHTYRWYTRTPEERDRCVCSLCVFPSQASACVCLCAVVPRAE